MEYSGQRYAVSLQDMSGTRTDGGLALKGDTGGTGSDLHQLPMTNARYAIMVSIEFHVHLLGNNDITGTAMTILQGVLELQSVPVLYEMKLGNSASV